MNIWIFLPKIQQYKNNNGFSRTSINKMYLYTVNSCISVVRTILKQVQFVLVSFLIQIFSMVCTQYMQHWLLKGEGLSLHNKKATQRYTQLKLKGNRQSSTLKPCGNFLFYYVQSTSVCHTNVSLWTDCVIIHLSWNKIL